MRLREERRFDDGILGGIMLAAAVFSMIVPAAETGGTLRPCYHRDRRAGPSRPIEARAGRGAGTAGKAFTLR
ncbi:MAG: hypothetical protein ABC537_04180 [Candidatus Methanosuratincola sp.]